MKPCVLESTSARTVGVLDRSRARSGPLRRSRDQRAYAPVEDRNRQQARYVDEGGAKIERVHVRALATEQCADKEPWEPLRRGLPTSKVGRLQLRSRCEQIRAAFEELCGLARLDVRNSCAAIRGLDRRRIGGLASDQHGDAVSRGGDQRFEGRYRRPRAGPLGTGALDIENGSEAHTMSCGHEAKRLVLSCRDCAYCLELLERTDEREVVRRNALSTSRRTPRACLSVASLSLLSGRTGPQRPLIDFRTR